MVDSSLPPPQLPLALKRWEFGFVLIYTFVFYSTAINISLRLSRDHSRRLYGLRHGWISDRLNDMSDAQWRNFHGNLPILTLVFGVFTLVAKMVRFWYPLEGRGTSVVWTLISLIYLTYLHGACVVYIVAIAWLNYLLVKIFVNLKHFLLILWIFNIAVLLCNRIYEGYSFSLFGEPFAILDNYRGTFRWHICFNLVILRMISFGCDYNWSLKGSHFDHEKHAARCSLCSSGKACYVSLQGKVLPVGKYSFRTYLCYLIYAPLYIAGPIVSFNAFAAQLDNPQRSHSVREVAWYGFRWIFSLGLMEIMTHFFYYSAFATSGVWRLLSPFEIFLIGYGVLNFMWLKFSLIWRYFRFWSLIGGIDTPENMPHCINNCHDLEGFWKSWHASFNKWLVRYLYVPLGGSKHKLLNIWVIFTFVALWHDLEWKLLSWAWLTCVFLVPEIVIKSSINAYKARSVIGVFIQREAKALAGAITISCLMVANLAGYVIGPTGINWLISRLLQKDGLPVLSVIFISFYVAVKLMLHIQEFREK